MKERIKKLLKESVNLGEDWETVEDLIRDVPSQIGSIQSPSIELQKLAMERDPSVFDLIERPAKEISKMAGVDWNNIADSIEDGVTQGQNWKLDIYIDNSHQDSISEEDVFSFTANIIKNDFDNPKLFGHGGELFCSFCESYDEEGDAIGIEACSGDQRSGQVNIEATPNLSFIEEWRKRNPKGISREGFLDQISRANEE